MIGGYVALIIQTKGEEIPPIIRHKFFLGATIQIVRRTHILNLVLGGIPVPLTLWNVCKNNLNICTDLIGILQVP